MDHENIEGNPPTLYFSTRKCSALCLTVTQKGKPYPIVDVPVLKTVTVLTTKGDVLYHTWKKMVNVLMFSLLIYNWVEVVTVILHHCLAYFARVNIIMTCVIR